MAADSIVQHTPGPWEVHDLDSPYVVHVVPKGKLSSVAVAYPGTPRISPNDKPLARANARLIAEAPQLLERLNETAHIVHENLHSGGNRGTTFTYCQFSPCTDNRAVLLAAKGDQP